VFEAHWSTDPARQFFHSSSYTANPIACAAANANLQIWRDEPVQARIDRLGQHLAAMLARLAVLRGVENPRRCGTILALDVSDPRGAGYLSDLGPRLRARFREHPVLLRPLGNTIYVMPPYCIDGDDLALVEAAIVDAVTELGENP
jgi:adenosylmethionine-8-amino-7-oxononanoate aminotransferase